MTGGRANELPKGTDMEPGVDVAIGKRAKGCGCVLWPRDKNTSGVLRAGGSAHNGGKNKKGRMGVVPTKTKLGGG